MIRRWLLAILLAAPLAASQAAEPIDLELALMVDVSLSIDEEEYRLQRNGYVRAFRNPAVQHAIGQGRRRAVAVMYAEWADYAVQDVVVEWTLLRSPTDANAFADRLERARPRHSAGSTSLSGAIDFAARQFGRAGYVGQRRVIDISGDGMNNSGRDPRFARDDAVRQGIVINGVAILTEVATLDDYYQRYVAGGDGAFVVGARDFGDFARAILGKLAREISGRPLDGDTMLAEAP
ncbi:MAG: DUF1194 domain-containing protein [Alphaproteobacteria bacterium]|nr:DUF1194 domain-containing protein [Alphaproteobacteria bacterium]